MRRLQDIYTHCIDGREDFIGQQIQSALDPDSGTRHIVGLLARAFEPLFISYYVGRVGLEPTTGGL